MSFALDAGAACRYAHLNPPAVTLSLPSRPRMSARIRVTTSVACLDGRMQQRVINSLTAGRAHDAACDKAVLSNAWPVTGSISSSSSVTAMQRHGARWRLL